MLVDFTVSLLAPGLGHYFTVFGCLLRVLMSSGLSYKIVQGYYTSCGYF